MCRPSRLNLISACISALLLAAMLLAAPAYAHADQVEKSIDSTLTITMQKPADGGSAGGAASPAATASGDAADADTQSKKSPATDDALPLAVAGIAALCAGAAYCLVQGRRLSVAQGARSAHPRDLGGAARRTVAVIVSAALVSGLCFGAFASKASAAEGDASSGADASGSDVECSANVVIDEEGNVLSAEVSLANNSEYTVDIMDLDAPDELSDAEWEALVEYLYWGEYAWDYDSWYDGAWYDGATAALVDAGSAETAATPASALAEVKAGERATGTWSGEADVQVPASVVAEVKAGGSARLGFKTKVYMGLPELMYGEVVFDANAPSGTTATVDGKSARTFTPVYRGTELTNGLIPADSKVSCSDGEYIFMGWAESSSAGASDAKKAADLAAAGVRIGNEMKVYYAVWVKAGYYWLNAAGASDPAKGILKTGSEIAEDMEVLHGTRAQTSAGKGKEAVAAEYANYMNGKSADGTADQEVRLYTKWGTASGEHKNAVTTGKNAYVEFRIIQVGEHDGDGSAVTFMATHSLPTTQRLKPYMGNEDGWRNASIMRDSVLAEGGYVQTGMPGLVPAAITVGKTCAVGRGYWSNWTPAVISEKFWLLSHTEVYGGKADGNDLVPTCYAEEGSQYDWFKSQGVSIKSTTSIAGMDRTRDGSRPADEWYTDDWWLRSPYLQSDGFNAYLFFGAVGNSGGASVIRPDFGCGLVLAFCM